MSRGSMKPLVALLAASLVLALGAATVSADSQRAFVSKLTMTGDQEVIGMPEPTCAPPEVCGDPDATGEARIWVIPARDLVCWRLSWSDIDGTVVAAHIHGPADTAHAAGVLVTFFQGVPHEGTDSNSGCTVSEFADTIAADPAMHYVNVHSSEFPAGAVRAQLG